MSLSFAPQGWDVSFALTTVYMPKTIGQNLSRTASAFAAHKSRDANKKRCKNYEKSARYACPGRICFREPQLAPQDKKRIFPT